MTEIASLSLHRGPVRLTSLAFPAFAAALAVAVGAAVAVSPALALVPVAVLVAVGLLTSARLRILVVIFGGLIALQSSQAFSLGKVAYLGFVSVAVFGAVLQGALANDSVRGVRARPLLAASAVLFGLVCISGVVAYTGATSLTAWLRDISAYVLLAAAPVFAIDAANRLERVFLARVFVAAGVLATISFAVSWLERRDLASLPIGKLFLPSTALAVAMIAYAFAVAHTTRQSRGPWFALAFALIALLLVTGTRTNLLVLIVPFTTAFASRHDVAHLLRLSVRSVVAATVAIAAAKAVGTVSGVNVMGATDRLASVNRLFEDPVASASLTERVQQSHLAWQTFVDTPLLGGGPGHTYIWRDQFGTMHSAFTMDTSLIFLSKFGLFGLLALVLLTFTVLDFRRRLPRAYRTDPAYVALIGAASFWVVSLPLGLPFEDKGFGLAMILSLALLLSRPGTADERIR